MCVDSFGLGWAHDALYVAYHMFMNFHAYILSIIFILILMLLVLFCVLLSLPLSFVSCSMAPKRKSSPSQNSFHSGASSSSDTTPSHVWFCDDKACKGLLGELFSTRHSFGTPSHSIGLFRYWPSHCHLQLRLGVIVWHPSHLFLRDHTWVLLQYARIRYFSTSLSLLFEVCTL